MIAVIDHESHKVLFPNHASISKFGEMSHLAYHQNIAHCATPCSFCQMPKTVESGAPITSEVPLPNDEHVLIQCARVEPASGQVHVVETITDITASKRQQAEAELLVEQLSATNRDLIHAAPPAPLHRSR